MVFAESLLAGCPIIYPKNAAVDGYFDNKNFAQAVPSQNVDAIADAMKKSICDQKIMKEELMEWQRSGDAEQFQHHIITKNYSDGLRHALREQNAH